MCKSNGLGGKEPRKRRNLEEKECVFRIRPDVNSQLKLDRKVEMR